MIMIKSNDIYSMKLYEAWGLALRPFLERTTKEFLFKNIKSLNENEAIVVADICSIISKGINAISLNKEAVYKDNVKLISAPIVIEKCDEYIVVRFNEEACSLFALRYLGKTDNRLIERMFFGDNVSHGFLKMLNDVVYIIFSRFHKLLDGENMGSDYYGNLFSYYSRGDKK